MATRVNLRNAIRKIEALGNVLHRPLRDVLDSAARVTAIECARTSQPFGTGADALNAGRKAVARDIAKVYATPGKAYEDISSARGKAAFWKAFKADDIQTAQRVLDEFGSNLRGVPMEDFDGGSAHKSARNSTTGRVNQSRPSMIVINPKALARYVEKIQDDVGFGKGGWADVARQISGSIRGLRSEGDITANWITRKAHGYGKVFRSGTDQQPLITIRNSVPYADQILNGTALAAAKFIAHQRMLKNLEIAVRSEVRNLRTAA